MTSSIIDLIIRIKNGYSARNEQINVLHSKMNVSVLEILKKEKYIQDFQIIEQEGKKHMVVQLSYDHGEPVFKDVAIVSKPGRRLYTKVKEFKPVLAGLGLAIVTTPKGIMTQKEARKQNVGGELLFKIW